MSESASPLPAETLVIEGPDAGTFMHGQFTSNVLALHEGQWQFSAWLDATGRVRTLFHLARISDQRWMLLLRGGRAEDMRNELARFVFRARIQLQNQPIGVLVMARPEALHVANDDGEVMVLGCGDHSLIRGATSRADSHVRAVQIRHGWPWLTTQALGQYNAASLGLHHLGAIALDKGCYPGQEIVARLHYRGGNKRRLCRVILSQNVGADAKLRQAVDGSEMHVLDIMQDGDRFHGLAIAHESWIAAAQDNQEMSDSLGTQVRIIETWPE